MSHEAQDATFQIACEISKLLTKYGVIPQGGFPETLQAVEKIITEAIDRAHPDPEQLRTRIQMLNDIAMSGLCLKLNLEHGFTPTVCTPSTAIWTRMHGASARSSPQNTRGSER